MLIRKLALTAILGCHQTAIAFVDEECPDVLSSTYCTELSAKRAESRKDAMERTIDSAKSFRDEAQESHKAALRAIQDSQERKAQSVRALAH